VSQVRPASIVVYKAEPDLIYPLFSSWIDLPGNTEEDIDGIYFSSENKGWVIGHDIVLSTQDGGNSWIEKEIATNGNYRSVFFADTLCGWISMNSGVIQKTTDGGENWQEFECGITESISDIFFVNNNKGWLSSGYGIIGVSDDGGETWFLQENPTTNSLSSIYFIDSLRGWMAGERTILSTHNGGLSWEVQYLEEGYPQSYFTSIVFSDTLNGWATGNTNGGHNLFHTTDGGANWYLQSDGVPKTSYYDMYFLDSEHGYLVGKNGSVLSTHEGTFMGPGFLSQPQDTIVCTGIILTIELDIVGDSMSFQWIKNHDVLEGAVYNPLIIDQITTDDGGVYSCIIYSKGGFEESDEFFVSCAPPVEITGHPQDEQVYENDTVIFNLAVSGALPISYQWQKNGDDIPGAIYNVYPIYGTQLADSGYYRCIVGNDCKTDTTNEAKLTVLPASSINEINEGVGISIIPNPVKSNCEIIFGKTIQNGKYEIYLVSGIMIKMGEINGSLKMVQMQNSIPKVQYILNQEAQFTKLNVSMPMQNLEV